MAWVMNLPDSTPSSPNKSFPKVPMQKIPMQKIPMGKIAAR